MTGAEGLPLDLTPEALDRLADAIADRLAERLRGTAPEERDAALLDAKEVARRCGRSRDWVYEHAGDLGAIRLGGAGAGKRPRLAFDPARVDAYLAPVQPADEAPPPTRSGARRARNKPEVPLLPIEGRSV